MCTERALPIYVGMDDTDEIGTPGTGHQARHLAGLVQARGATCAVSRHQLLVHPDVPMTKNNSANVVHVWGWTAGQEDLFALACQTVDERSAPGADPAVCVAQRVHEEVQRFGARAQSEILQPREALALASEHHMLLDALWDRPDGLVGALAGLGLASTGRDGRFVMVGRIRELAGEATVQEVLAAGVVAVRMMDGTPVHEGTVAPAERMRPSLVDHQPVLYVEPSGGGVFAPVHLDKAPCYLS